MATRTWNGGTGDWSTDADWSPSTPGSDVPQPGDTAVIASGTVTLTDNAGALDQLFENNAVSLGGAVGATLLLQDALPTGGFFNLTFKGNGTLEASGTRGFAGNVSGRPNDGSTITFKADPGGNLVLLHGGTFNVQDRVIDFEGNVTLERSATVSGNIVNNGTLSILSGRTALNTNDLSGTGTIAIGKNATLFFDGNGFGGANQTISFAGTGGTIDLNYNTPSNFSGTIQNFAPGDSIVFTGFGAVTSATLDTTAHTLTIDDATGRTYLFNKFYGEAGALTSVTQDDGFSRISYASAAPQQLDDQIGAGAEAMHADTVHSMTVPGTATPITGAGIKIGIISNSFNVQGGASTDIANGYLPSDGVTVLTEGPAGSDDEGRAMAELIHQTAPDAKLYFASTGTGINDFASSVQALQAAGCNVIVDDISLIGSEPFFQLGSPADNAISNAIAHGVTYVTSDGNYGNAFYQHSFSTTQQTLYDGSSVQAMTFSNGTPYQSVTATGGLYDTIDLQWDAPFYGTGGVASDQPCCVLVKAFDASNNLIATSQQVSLNGHLAAESELVLPYSGSSKTYNIAIYEGAGAPAISQVKYILSGASTGANVGGTINDPDAGVGSGATFGHQLVPGAIAVAAQDVTNTSAFGRSPDYSESFTSTGPGTLLFDAEGNRYANPVTAGSPDLTGPDGIETSVSGFTPFYGTSAAAPNVAAVAALLLQVNPNLTPAAIASILADSAVPLSGSNAKTAGAGLVQADKAVLLAEQEACYCQGTAILTVDGERTVESLKIGDRVVTASGAHRPIKWIGHRAFAGRFANTNPHALPICFKAGSLADNVPKRDLWVSPNHAMFLDGALFPAGTLVNGVSVIKAERVDSVTYWHVELDSHDVLLAEGAPSESFVDDNSRGMFHNAYTFAAMYPDDAVPAAAVYCAPRHEDGHPLEAVRRTLAARAGIPADWPDCGLLHGYVDAIDGEAVRGWARSARNPAMPVCLDLVVDGHLVAQVLANRSRADLEAAGYGPHAFEIALPATCAGKNVVVRRSSDGAKLKVVVDRAA